MRFTSTVKVPRQQVQPGDVVLNCMGQAILTVYMVSPARARGYTVIQGVPLVKGLGHSISGFSDELVSVRR